MGIYLNSTNDKFKIAVNSQIYVDKTELIQITNRLMATESRFLCVSRPRRFGKSMAANMLNAYYSRGCDSSALFASRKIANSENYEKYRNQYDVIFVNMQEFLSRTKDVYEMVNRLKKMITRELVKEYPDADYFDREDLAQSMQDAYEVSRCPFVVIIDEWDCVLREYKKDQEVQKFYLDFLRDLLKDKGYIHLAYMTGILPVKKYGTHSALNMFREYSMMDAGELAEYVGFLECEVKELCDAYEVDFQEMKRWYDGYEFSEVGSVYNPQSVVFSIQSRKFNNYWNQTETYEALREYIDMNFDGLKDSVLKMMGGEHVGVYTGSFANDMTTFASKDDVMTLLIHLGYLGYDFENEEVFIPNNEIMNEFANAVRNSDWGEVTKALILSKETLQAIWDKDSEKVAVAIQEAHFETSYLQYHDENALSYTISLALFAARNYYIVVREFPMGKGIADMVYLPKKEFPEKPALVVELKWDKTSQGAIGQIKNKEYGKTLEDYTGEILLVGINYNRKTKEHQCKIEEYRKNH